MQHHPPLSPHAQHRNFSWKLQNEETGPETCRKTRAKNAWGKTFAGFGPLKPLRRRRIWGRMVGSVAGWWDGCFSVSRSLCRPHSVSVSLCLPHSQTHSLFPNLSLSLCRPRLLARSLAHSCSLSLSRLLGSLTVGVKTCCVARGRAGPSAARRCSHTLYPALSRSHYLSLARLLDVSSSLYLVSLDGGKDLPVGVKTCCVGRGRAGPSETVYVKP